MPQILSTTGSSHAIELIISRAKEYIVLVTPYLKITPTVLSRLVQASRRNIRITILFRENELTNEQRNKIEPLENINLYSLKRLHAKCYFNEEFGIMSSMNLHESSQINNWELGIAFDEEDDEIFKDQLLTEVDLMLDNSTTIVEKFKRLPLVKKKFLERLSEYLNNKFKTKKFHYIKDSEEFFDEYVEEINCNGFPIQELNIRIINEGTRIDFVLNLPENDINNLQSSLNMKIFQALS